MFFLKASISKIFTVLYLAFVWSALLSAGSETSFGITNTKAAIAGAGAVTINLADFGAAGDGMTDDGPALQRALDALAGAGGGTLNVPAGNYAIRTTVEKDFTGLANSVEIRGVESSTPVDTSYTPDVLTRGLDLTSRFFPMTGPSLVTIRVSGLQNFTIKDIAFEGTPGFENDAMITLDLHRVEQATVQHCEFYGLRTDTEGGAIISARRSRLKVEQTMFLGTFGYSALYVPVIQNLEWKDINITTTIFADYGQHPGFHGKTQGATFSWVTIGNPAATDTNSPRREVVIRDVIMDEGAMFAIFAQPTRFQSPSPPIDLLYVTELFQNVSNLGTAGNLIYDVRNVLIEDSHYGYSHYTNAAIDLNNIGTAIIDRVECVDSANKIRADFMTGKLFVINSIYDEVISQAQTTRLMQNVSDDNDPVWYVRQQFQTTLKREPEPSEHFYWSDRILACNDNAQCVASARAAFAAHLAAAPSPTFDLTGKVLDEDGIALPDVTVTLSGSQAIVTQTNGAGEYKFSGLPTSGNYTIVASKNHYSMGPSSRTLVAPIGNRAENFTATAQRYAIRGRVVTTNNYGFQGVPILLSGAQSATVTTDKDGFFSFTNLRALRTYTITPTLTNHTFAPSSQTINSLVADQSLNFYGSLNNYTISGRLADGKNKAFGGVAVSLSGALLSATTTTDANGNYSFANVPASGNYSVAPSAANYTFAPASRVFNNLSGNETANFTVLYSIRGRVASATNNALSGVTITLSGAQSATTTTDANGNYSFANLAVGVNYTVTPTLTNYTFSPASLAFNNLSANGIGDFTATLNTYTLSGQIKNAANANLAGVTVTLSGARSAMTTTDTAGNYSFANLPPAANYTLTASLTHYTFAPPSVTFNNLSGNQTTNFKGTLNTFSISGRTTLGASGLGGVTVRLSGSQTATTTTDTNGNYSFSDLPAGGNFTVAASLANYTFAPLSASVSNLSANHVNNFAATLNNYTISGRVADNANNALAGVTLNLTGARNATVVSGADGLYSFADLPAGGNFTVTPSLANYTFAPLSASVSNLSANQVSNFAATLNNYTISGRVADGANNALAGVTLNLTGARNATVVSGADGLYSFANLPAGGNFTVTASLTHYTFAPPSATFNNLSGNQTTNFKGTLNTFSISGRTTLGASGLGGVTVRLSGSQTATTTTDTNGNYSFSDLPAGGNFTITPSLANYTFAPLSASVSNLSANHVNNFAATLNNYTISGRVADNANNALAGVTLNLTGARNATVVSGADGLYSFANLPAAANYTVTAVRANYTFAPLTYTASNLSGDQTTNFTGTLKRYVISGHVSNGANGFEGVTVRLSGAQAAVATTDAAGNYSFANLPAEGNYTVTLSKAGYAFTPPSRTIDVLNSDRVENFSAALEKYEIWGRVININNYGLQGITLTLSGARSATTVTDKDGYFSFPNLEALGNYTITPTLKFHSFEQPAQTFNSLTDRQSVSFIARLNSHTISGRVTDGASNGLGGVHISLTGTQLATTTTDANGNYSLANLPAGGNYTLAAYKPGYLLTPPARVINELGANRTESFTAIPLYSVAGTVSTADGKGLSGVTVALEGLESRTVVTDSNGKYSFANIPGGTSITLTPSKANYVLSPLKQTIVIDSDKPNVNFTAALTQSVVQFSAASYQSNEGDAQATITVVRTGNTSIESSFTFSTIDDQGQGSCLETGGAASYRCDYAGVFTTLTFAPGEVQKTVIIPLIDDAHPERIETLQFSLLNEDDSTAIGTINTASLTITDNDNAGAPNPILSTPLFVRMQYLDFLSREPEAGEPWSEVLNRCPNLNNDPSCDRIRVSASFFNSPEFRLKGFYAFMHYRVAFDRRPDYDEIIPDMRSLSGATEQEVYQKRANLPVNFTERTEFKGIYNSLTDTTFVNTLLNRYALQQITTPDPATPEGTSKIVLTRADLISRLGASGAQSLTRAQVLRAVVESNEVGVAEYNRAFVAMQYYGYLRRTPEEDGYQAWLKVINQDPNNIRIMINGFMNSTEYRLRFGQP